MGSKIESIYTEKEFQERINEISLHRVTKFEKFIIWRIMDLDRFYPWPALRESFLKDLRKVRRAKKALSDQ